MQTNKNKIFLTQKDLFDRWSISIRTLEGWRYRGIGPVYTKIGARILYPIDEVEKFEAAGIVKTGGFHD